MSVRVDPTLSARSRGFRSERAIHIREQRWCRPDVHHTKGASHTSSADRFESNPIGDGCADSFGTNSDYHHLGLERNVAFHSRSAFRSIYQRKIPFFGLHVT